MNVPNTWSSAAFKLGPLLVQPGIGLIRGANGEARLEPRVMMVLETLARSPGQLVSRADLLDKLWSGAEVYDEALTQCVYQLRQQMLKAGGEACRDLVTTVPKRGYVLKGDVETVSPEIERGEKHPDSSRRFRAPVILAGFVAAAILVWALWPERDEQGPPTSALAETVAVLPFLPLVESDREPALELGMADTLITRLSRIEPLIVRPMSSVRRFNDPERDSLEVGRQLGVDAVVDGSIQHSGDTLRVTARLLRVSDGTALWADTMSGSFGDIFSVQDEICTRIADALALQLGQDERRDMARGGTANTLAYEHYMQGRYHLARLTPRDLSESLEHFRAAVELDPEYTQAWLGLANVQFRSPIAGEKPALEYYPRAIEAAHRALELDPSSAEAFAMLGWIAHWYEWDWAASEAHFKRAIELNPNDTESHLGYAHLLSTMGRYEEAIVEGRRARELSPNYMAAAALEGGFMMRAGKFEEALHYLEAAREVGENLWLFRITIAGAYAANGRMEEALVEMEHARALTDNGSWVSANLIGMLNAMGRKAEAEALFSNLLQRSQERFVPPYDMAIAYKAMGDMDSALTMLEQAFELRDPKFVFITQGVWSPLRDEARFDRLVQQLNLQPEVG